MLVGRVVLGADGEEEGGWVRRVSPCGGWVTEVVGQDGGRGYKDGVGFVLMPVDEEGIRRVCWDDEALDLGGGVGGAGVEHDEVAVWEDGGRASPDAIGVVPVVGDHSDGEVEPV